MRNGARGFALVFLAAFGSASMARSQTDVVSLAGARLNSAWNDERYVELSTSAFHSVALRADGSLEAWGAGSGVLYDIPQPPEGARFIHVAAGGSHSLGLLEDGKLVSWGSNLQGQCQVPDPGSRRRYVAIAAGDAHSLALVDDGTVVAFGRTHEGQCHVPPLPEGIRYVQIAACEDHSIALRSDGQAVSWGEPVHGLHEIPRSEPDNPYVQVATGWGHNVLLRADGTVVGSGINLHRQLEIPDPPGGTSFVQVRAGRTFTLTLRSDGAVQVWGYLEHLGRPIQWYVPPAGRRVAATTAWGDHALLLLDNGAMLALGFSWNWQACNLPKLPLGIDYVQLEHDEYYSSGGAVLSDGSIRLWGGCDLVAQGAPALPPGTRYTDLELNEMSALALRDDGVIVTWGMLSYGQSEVPMLPAGVVYTDIALLGGVSLAVASDGSLVAWGTDSSYASLLDVPDLPPGTHYVSVSGEGLKVLALRSDGVVVAWGWDAFGYVFSAPPPPPGHVFADVDAGEWAHVARTDQGLVAVWGTHCGGSCEAPLPLNGSSIVDAAAGYHDVYGVLDDGSLVSLEAPMFDAWKHIASPSKGRHLAVTARRGTASATVAKPACEGTVRSFCTPSHAPASGQSAGCFQVLGCADHDLTTLTFAVGGLPPQSVGYFVYGDTAVGSPFGTTGLCIGGPAMRIPALFEADGDGDVVYGIDVNAPPLNVPDRGVLPGETRAFQYLYRVPADGAQVMFTNAVEITFAP